NDSMHGGSGYDQAYAESSDAAANVEHSVTVQIKDLGTSIKVEGSPAFQARVEADLEMLRSSPDGQQMVAALDQGAPCHTVTIREYNDASQPDNSTTDYIDGQVKIAYNPALADFPINGGPDRVQGPPITVLYHEMAHAYDYENGTLAPGL